ncbi:MAG TPA: SCO family protein [Bacillota bacterium]
MKKIFSAVILTLITVLLLAGCNKEKIETNMSETVADFEFTTQDGETLSLDDLKGDYWLTDFIFTNCETVCLPMTSNMKELQDKLKEEDIDFQLVSFSVDPDYDTPEVLREYAEEYGADTDSWTFLTGYDFETIEELSIKSFRNLVAPAPEGDDQVTHGTGFFLVNPEGEIIKKYDGVDSGGIDYIFRDLKKVKEEE